MKWLVLYQIISVDFEGVGAGGKAWRSNGSLPVHHQRPALLHDFAGGEPAGAGDSGIIVGVGIGGLGRFSGWGGRRVGVVEG